MHEFFTRLKSLRIEKRLTENQCAEYLNISLKQYQEIEAGMKYPDNSAIFKLTRLLNVPLHQLLGNYHDLSYEKAENMLLNLTEENKKELCDFIKYICENEEGD